jgi:uncharacterized protein YaaW (UPF0174 family)
MMYTIEDIRKLLAKASPDERRQLAEILDTDLEGVMGPRKEGEALVRQLYWKYQTPLGYFTRDPFFDEVAVDVAKRLKMEGLTKQETSSWDMLSRLIRNLMEELLKEMTPEQRGELASRVLTADQIKEFYGNGTLDWGKVGAGSILLAIKQFGGFATYKVALIVANQAARALIGRGLSLAANAALVRGLSIFLGPVGWILLAWGINDSLGTNYKRVIPGVLYIYCIYERLKDEGQLPF